MYQNWFICKMQYDKTMENGMSKRVTEQYLVDAMSFTEAEARIIVATKPFITGESRVADISRYRISELFFNDEGEGFWKFKVNFITVDESSGKERKTPTYMLVQASDLTEAKAVLEERMKGTMADYEVESVSETKIEDVFPFVETKGEGS